MRKFIKTLVLIAIIIEFPLFSKVKAESIITVNELIENAKEFDGRKVTIEGEAIGELLERGHKSWINLNDGTNAIGLWSDTDKTRIIKFYGDYKHKGDNLKITGTFYRACKEHGGEADIHISTLSLVSNGYTLKESINSEKLIIAMILSITAILLYLKLRKKIKLYKVN